MRYYSIIEFHTGYYGENNYYTTSTVIYDDFDVATKIFGNCFDMKKYTLVEHIGDDIKQIEYNGDVHCFDETLKIY